MFNSEILQASGDKTSKVKIVHAEHFGRPRVLGAGWVSRVHESYFCWRRPLNDRKPATTETFHTTSSRRHGDDHVDMGHRQHKFSLLAIGTFEDLLYYMFGDFVLALFN